MADDNEYTFKVNIPETADHADDDGGNKNRKLWHNKKIMAAALTVAVAAMATGILAEVFINSPKQVVTAGMKRLAAGSEASQPPSLRSLNADKLADELMNGRTHTDFSLNVSNTDEWPVTLGIDGSAVRSSAEALSIKASISVANTHIADLSAYADDDEIAVQLPDLCSDVFTMSPEHIGRQFNKSQMSYVTGITLNDFSLNMFPKSYSHGSMDADRTESPQTAGQSVSSIIRGMHVIGRPVKSGKTKAYEISLENGSWNAINSIFAGMQEKAVIPAAFISDDVQWKTYAITKPYPDLRIVMEGRNIRQISIPDISISDGDISIYDIKGLGFDIDTDGTRCIVSAAGKMKPMQPERGKGSQPVRFSWTRKTVAAENDMGDYRLDEKLDLVSGEKETKISLNGSEKSADHTASYTADITDGENNGKMCFSGIFGSSSVNSGIPENGTGTLTIGDITFWLNERKICKLTGKVGISEAGHNEKAVFPKGSKVSLFDLDVPELYAYVSRFETSNGIIREMLR